MARVNGRSKSMVLMGSAESGVNCSTHEIVAAELSLSNVTDAEVLPNLLDSNVPSKTAARWEIKPKKLQCSGWRDLRYDQSAEQAYRTWYA